MSAQILDGAALAKKIRAELADEVVDFIENNIAAPTHPVLRWDWAGSS